MEESTEAQAVGEQVERTEEVTGGNEPSPKKAKLEEISTVDKKDENQRPQDLQKFWKAVEDDPTDFTGWTYLLQYVDSNSELHHGQEAFDKFLHRYPYCYGYWKKYADFEKRKGTKERCMLVFERSIEAIPLSADLWIHYLNHVKGEYSDNPGFIRAQYERALGACGREWRSDKLWDHFVKWETEQKELVRVLKLYDRILRNPTQGLSHQFEMLRGFVKEHNPKDMLEVNDFLAIRKEVLASANKDEKEEVAREEEKTGEEGVPGEDGSKAISEEENTSIRDKIIQSYNKAFKDTEAKVQKRWKFEDSIKRPYFHMKPLERGQLKNWNEYLDHEIEDKEVDDELVQILFERCLIACALYEEFWMKYLKWTKSRENLSQDEKLERMRDIFERACKHHLPNKLDIHLQYAAFEEENRDFDKAAEILKKLEEKNPEMLSLMVRSINLERRRGSMDQVHQKYKKCIEKAKTNFKPDLSVKYARFLRLQLNDIEASEKIIQDALLEDEKNPKLYLQLLDIQLHQKPLDLSKIVKLFDTALEKSVQPKHKLLFSQRKVEFLEDFGTNIADLNSAQEAHNKLTSDIHSQSGNPAEETETNGQESSGSGVSSTGAKKSNGSVTYPATNSAAYNAQHANQYQQYGSRYNAQYGGSAYGQYGGYYGGYGAPYSGYGGNQ